MNHQKTPYCLYVVYEKCTNGTFDLQVIFGINGNLCKTFIFVSYNKIKIESNIFISIWERTINLLDHIRGILFKGFLTYTLIYINNG